MASLCISVRAWLLLICSSLAAVLVLTSSPASADTSSLSSLSSTQWMQHLSRPGPYGVRKIKLALAPDVANRDEEAARLILGDSDEDQNATTIEKKEVKYTSLKQPDDEINDFELWMPTLQNEHMSIGESSSSSLSHTWHSPFWSSSQTFPPFRAFIAMSAPMVREFCGWGFDQSICA